MCDGDYVSLYQYISLPVRVLTLAVTCMLYIISKEVGDMKFVEIEIVMLHATSLQACTTRAVRCTM
jgi:hypothetical protein